MHLSTCAECSQLQRVKVDRPHSHDTLFATAVQSWQPESEISGSVSELFSRVLHHLLHPSVVCEASELCFVCRDLVSIHSGDAQDTRVPLLHKAMLTCVGLLGV